MNYALTPQQLAVICALSSGVTTLAAAEQAGVHRNTINSWRRNSLHFQRALADAQYDRALYFRESIEDLADLAVKAIHEILADPKTPPAVRLKAALAIISTASTPPQPKKQVELDIERIVVAEPHATPPPVHNPAQPTPQPATPPMHKVAQPSPEPTVHTSAQPSAEPLTPDTPAAHNPAQRPPRREVARNAQCPCGSSKKYKRCCLDSLARAA